jgi:outer membrane immunogenic protein
MKHIISFLFIIAIIFSISSVNAQGPVGPGEKQLNAGLGFSDRGLPVYVGLDFGVHPDITVGGEISFRAYNEKFKDDYYFHQIIGFIGNGNYHFNTLFKLPPEWNVYAGLNIGFFARSSPDYYPGTEFSGLRLGAQIGGRYYFNDRFGINLEIGGGSVFNEGKFGVSFKL